MMRWHAPPEGSRALTDAAIPRAGTALSSSASLLPSFAPAPFGLDASFAPHHGHQKYRSLAPLSDSISTNWRPVRRMRNGYYA